MALAGFINDPTDNSKQDSLPNSRSSLLIQATHAVRNATLKLIMILGIGWIFAAFAVFAQESSGSERSKVRQLDEHSQSLDYIFEKVRDTTWEKDFDLDGWREKTEEIRRKLTPDSRPEEVRALMGELLGWLKKSHFGIYAADLYDGWDSDSEDSEAEDKDGHTGVSFRLVDDRMLVSEVRAESDAAKQGIQLGWELIQAQGNSIDEFKAKMLNSLTEEMKKHFPTVIAFALESRMNGAVGSKVPMRFRDKDDKIVSLKIQRTQKTGEVTEVFNLPKMFVRHKVEELPGGVAYQKFDYFFAPTQVLGDLRTAIEIARNGKGLIIDLRGNRGGIGGMAMGIGGPLIDDDSDESKYLGTLITRDAKLKFVLVPRLNPYNGPVAVLTDEMSASTSEVLAGGLQAIGRARIFGTRTAGMALPSMIDVLPNGDRFQYAIATYRDAQGRTLEGDGVVPDVEVVLTREDLLNGHDAVLDAALKWIATE